MLADYISHYLSASTKVPQVAFSTPVVLINISHKLHAKKELVLGKVITTAKNLQAADKETHEMAL